MQPDAFVLNRSGTTLGLNIDLRIADQTLADGTHLVDVVRIDFRGGTGADTATGGDYDDTLVGGGGADSLNGGSGADLLTAIAGYKLFGGSGDDLIQVAGAGTVDGGAGFDVLQVSATTTFAAGSLSGLEEVWVNGGLKLDVSALTSGLTIQATAGAAAGINVVGTSGADQIVGGAGPNTLDGGGGSDTLLGGASRDSITCGPGFDVVFSYGGDDIIQVKRGTGPDQIDGGDGVDLLNADYTTAVIDLKLDITNAQVVQLLGDGTSIVDIEQLKIIGGSGRDVFTGGAFADTLSGGAGDDILRGGPGSDVINGDAGYDIAVYGRARDQFQITSLGNGSYSVSGGVDSVDTITGVETLRFADGDMPIAGYTAAAVYWGSPNGSNTVTSSSPVPDGRGAIPGTGFTNTGLTRAPDGTWWLANQGQADATDTTYTPSLVHLSADFSTKLGELALGGKIRSLQGLAYDTQSNQLLVASLSEHIVRVVNLNGTLAGTITLGTSVSPNGLAYDPVLNAAIVGRSEGSPSNGVVEWRSVSGGAVIKTLTLANNPDHLFFEPSKGAQGTLYYSYGSSGTGAVGYVVEVDVGANREIGRYTLPEADAIEGIHVQDGVLWANNDAYYHRGVSPVNSVLQFEISPSANIVDHAQSSVGDTIDLAVHDQTMADGSRLVGAERLFFRGGTGDDRVTGGDYPDVIVGDGGADTLVGGGGNDRLVGGDAADVLTGGAGDDGVEGGPGADVVVFSGARADYQIIALGATSAQVVDGRPGSPDGRDKVVDVESYRFADATFTYARAVLPGVSSVDLSNVVLPENSAGGFVIGSLSAVFDAGPSTFTYTLVDNPGDHFAISGNRLLVAPGAVLDYEISPVHGVTIRATAANGTFLDTLFTLGLTDVDEAPTAVRLQNATPVPQYTTGRMHVADLVADDPDTDPAFRNFSFTVNDARFEIVEGGLYLREGQTVDWTQPAFTLGVTVTEGPFTLTQTVNVPITEAPAPVTSVSLSGGAIAEGSPAGTAVGTLSAEDAAGHSNFTFTLLDGDDARFVLQGSQILLASGAGLDFETGPSREITVRATSASGLSHVQTFTIGVTDVDEAPTDIVLQNPAELIENNSARTRLADLTVADPDTNPAFQNNVLSVDDARFEIVDGSLYLRAGHAFDFETEPSVVINITVNEGPYVYTRAFELQVTDVAEGPAFSFAGAAVDENSAAGASAGTLTPADGASSYTYSLIVDDGGRFAIQGAQVVVASGANLDFEATPSRAVTVRAVAVDGSASQRTFSIGLRDVNEAPTDLSLANTSPLVENTAVRTRLADLTVTDPDTDPAFRTFAFSVDDARFEVTDGSLYLRAGQTVDYETQSAIDLRVTVTNGVLTYAETFSLAVQNVAEAPSFTLSPAALAENSAAGTSAGTLAATEPATSFTYTLVNDDGGRFALQGDHLVLQPNHALDFEAAATAHVTVRAAAADGGTTDKAFSIAVTDVNEAPTDVALQNTVALVENTAARTRLADLAVTDPDTDPAFRTFSFSLDDARFEVTDGSLYLRAGQTVDYEAASSIPLQITVTNGALTYVKPIVLPVMDVAESSGPFVLNRTGTTLGLSVDLNLTSQTLADGTVLGPISQIDFRGGTGADTVIARDAADTLVGGAGADSLSGGEGADSLAGGVGSTLAGGGGDDALQLSGAPGLVDGGAGTDTLTLTGAVTFATGSLTGVERIIVQPGVRADFSQLTSPVAVTTGLGAAADTLVGTTGADSLSGGDGADSLDGGSGNDSVSGGAGADKITGGSGRDTLNGGDGADSIEIKRGTGPDDVDGGAGSDILSADFGKMTAGMVIDISNPGVVQRLSDGTSIVNFEQINLTAGAGSDLIVGGAFADAIAGLAGNDTLNGGGGADTLNGGDGADVLIGGAGDDSLTGAAGADRFAPGVSGWGTDRIMSFEHGIDVIDLRGFGLTYGDLVISQSGSTITIGAGALGSFILLNNVGAVTNGDFLFV